MDQIMSIFKILTYSIIAVSFASCKATSLNEKEIRVAAPHANYVMVDDTLIVYSDMFSDFLIEGSLQSLEKLFKGYDEQYYDANITPDYTIFFKSCDYFYFREKSYEKGLYGLSFAYIIGDSFPRFPLHKGEKKLSVLKKLGVPLQLCPDVVYIIIVSPDTCLNSNHEIDGKCQTINDRQVDAVYISFDMKDKIFEILVTSSSDGNLFHPVILPG